ncbi:hypothetical protein G6L12_30815 [Agrobacterium rhizogenes]|nr:hypothetical protein [Rhizobium rhizogenes]NTF78900.1 hypothetical protein [Rhizobium rhizogenes]
MSRIGISALMATVICLLGDAGAALADCALPTPLINGQTADATAVMDNMNAVAQCTDQVAPAGSTNALQYNGGSGSFAPVGPLTDGQIIIGATGNPPRAAALVAGPGIAILNQAGGIAIGAGSVSASVDWLNASAVVQPHASDFTVRTSTSAPPGATLVSTTRGVALTSTGATSATAMMAEVSAPSGHWQATMLSVYTGPLSSYGTPSIAVRDAVNNKTVLFGIGGSGSANGSGLIARFDYQRFSGGIGLNTYSADTSLQDPGLPFPGGPIWTRLTYDGTNLTWSFSRDGQQFTAVFSIAATAYIANLTTMGPAVTFQQTVNSSWSVAYHILSWSVVSI